ncbi:sensor histidine kinase [Methylobacterium sp. WSM2598]|uniref:sensor histidine kinase n=1 Tax=Methylobacterium sp. WSM2598 TaxID=398261 RepID=UPI0003787C94|nr:sensor histidine kinase [Methylobacterium sp. WSM2598]
MTLIRAMQRFRRNPWLGHGIGLLLFLTAVALRAALGSSVQGVPFITFFPAVVAAAVLGGVRAGAVTVLLTAGAAILLFWPTAPARPVGWPGGAVALGLYLCTTGAVLWIIDALNRTLDDLIEERDRSAAMFEELQHRVANNLSLIASLLRLEQRRLQEGEPCDPVEVLERAQGRLALMARIHRRLHDPQAAERPVEEQLRDLCADLLEAVGAAGRIRCDVAAPGVRLDLRRLVPLALIVAETVTNAVKHAFPDERSGQVAITLDRAGDDLDLAIRDDGVGLPPGFDPETSRSLGLRIVRSLARQLGGEVEITSGPGVTTRVRFPA